MLSGEERRSTAGLERGLKSWRECNVSSGVRSERKAWLWGYDLFL